MSGMSGAGTIAVPETIDGLSFTLPDVKGWIKSKFRKPPPPPFWMVVWGFCLAGSSACVVADMMTLIREREPKWALYAASQACFVRIYWNWFMVEYRKWRNEWSEKPKPVPVRLGTLENPDAFFAWWFGGIALALTGFVV